MKAMPPHVVSSKFLSNNTDSIYNTPLKNVFVVKSLTENKSEVIHISSTILIMKKHSIIWYLIIMH